MSTTNLIIDALGAKGDGTARGARGRVYVEGAIPGDRIRARLFKGKDGVSRGELVEILAPSPNRQTAPCVHYDQCGGCTLQHLSSDYYRRSKIDLVEDAFRRIGLRPRQWMPPIFIGGKNRRRATFAAENVRGRVTMGYYRRRSRNVTDVSKCLVADPRILELRAGLAPFLGSIVPEGSTVDIFVQLVGNDVDLVITGQIGRGNKPDGAVKETLVKVMRALSITRISWRNHERDEAEMLLNQGPVLAEFGSLKVNLPPAAFLQPTVEGEQALVNAVTNALPKQGRFADLFCGAGTFTGPMFDRCGNVDAYESMPRSVQALTRAAGKQPVRVFRRDLYRHPLRRDELNRYDAIVFDPPRSGCPEQATQMAGAKASVLVGVSCNPATFARDAALICDGGYWLQSLQIVDQFLWSHHVEVVGVFTRQKRGPRD